MSFSGEFRHSLLSGRAKAKCCRIAFVSGYFTGAGKIVDDRTVEMTFTDPETVSVLSEYLPAFDRDASLCVEGTRLVKTLRVSSAGAVRLLSEDEVALPEFRCNACKGNYLAGLFSSCGHVSDPAREWFFF